MENIIRKNVIKKNQPTALSFSSISTIINIIYVGTEASMLNF